MHSEVEYIVAHGIASRVGEEKVVIGSAHFVFEDEQCVVPEGEQAKFDALPNAVHSSVPGHWRRAVCRHLHL